ncbi:MAG: reprolysin-like metallopeptidase [Blastocatellia bacterium]
MFALRSRAIVISIFAFLVCFQSTFAQSGHTSLWQEIDDSPFRGRESERTIVPERYRTFRLNQSAMRSELSKAPEEFSQSGRSLILSLPMPDGTLGRFRVEHSLIVEPGLLKKYPELGETYTGRGIDDPTATVRFDFLPTGFHAMILSSRGTVMIDPYFVNQTDTYVSYLKRDAANARGDFACQVGKTGFDTIISLDRFQTEDLIPDSASAPEVTSGTQLRTYRLAVAATVEYTTAVGGGTVAGALAAQVLIMNRVNGVYEREVAIRMVVVANNNLVVYTAEPDPYTNDNGVTMLGQNQTNLDTVIGPANYDIGHVFSTGGGGVATLNAPCGGSKARGVTGLPNPVGDPFAIDYVAHEMGHQWGANHTFNTSCSGNRSAGSAYEPGSGVTIMGYAGVCGTQDLDVRSIDTFHVKSLEVIVAFSQTGNGNTCAVPTASGNTPPLVSVVGGPAFNIPKQTPFTLTATGSDTNGDSLTYDWQEYDLGASTSAIPNTDSDGTARPIFRPYLPTSGGSRTFPSLQYILANANVPPGPYDCGFGTGSGACMTGELLPAITRTMTFQVIARDNRANAGGINTATATVNVDGNSGPFVITAPNTGVTWAGNSSQTVTWNIANTTAAPVNAANVRILFSADAGQTFPTLISASTANDGTQLITVPNIATTQGRIKIEGDGNIFFDISDANFTVTQSAATADAPFDFDGDNKTDISIFRPGPGEWWYQQSSNSQVSAAQFGTTTDRITPADFTGDGKADLAFWRPSTGFWFVLRSENFTFFGFPFGTNGDIPAPADYDGDQKADAAVFRPSSGTWFINRSSDGGTTFAQFGIPNDKPVVADYDGDGRADIAVFRPAPGEWWISQSTAGLLALQFGSLTDRPVPGDYTGDGKADVAFWRPSNGNWFIARSENATFFAFPFGAGGDTPAPGDYDGDGRFDAAVFRPTGTTWFVNRSTAGVLIQQFGLASDVPVPSSFVP